MSARTRWALIAAATVGLGAAGCDSSKPESIVPYGLAPIEDLAGADHSVGADLAEPPDGGGNDGSP